MAQMDPNQQAQARARVEAMRRQFEQKRAISESLSRITHKVGVYSGKGGAMKIAEAPTVGDNDKMLPPERFGVKAMSMGFFQKDEEEAIIWRGPMIHNAINQLLQSTEWGELDYLIVDLPPGTSDAPLTVMQSLEMDGFVVVTTPQELAVIDAIRSINMIRKLRIEVLGVVENFSGDIFGSGAGAELAERLEIPLLGNVEMRADYRDTSMPAALNNNRILDEYRAIAKQVTQTLPAA